MKNFWKIAVIIGSLAAIFLLASAILPGSDASAVASAPTLQEEMQTQTENFAGKSGAGLGKDTVLLVMVALIVKVALSFIGTIFTVYLVYGGFLFITSAGEEEKITKAKHIVTNGAIGIAVVLSAWGIAWLVIGFIRYSFSDSPTNWGQWSSDTNNMPANDEYKTNIDGNIYIK